MVFSVTCTEAKAVQMKILQCHNILVKVTYIYTCDVQTKVAKSNSQPKSVISNYPVPTVSKIPFGMCN